MRHLAVLSQALLTVVLSAPHHYDTRRGQHEEAKPAARSRRTSAFNSIRETVAVSKANTVTVVIFSRSLTLAKKKIMEILMSQSPYRVLVAYDIAKTPPSGLKVLTEELGAELLPMSNDNLVEKFGSKIENFNGKYGDNPARLGCLEWFARSGYEHVWMLEDDTFARDFGSFVDQYDRGGRDDDAEGEHASSFTRSSSARSYDGTDTDSASMVRFDRSDAMKRTREEREMNDAYSRADVVASGHAGLPFWVAHKWRVGDLAHALKPGTLVYSTAWWCVLRVSKHAARSVIDQIAKDNTTSHHEIYLPFVVRARNLKWLPLDDRARRYLTLNSHNGRQSFLTLNEAIHRADLIVAHPVKYFGTNEDEGDNHDEHGFVLGPLGTLGTFGTLVHGDAQHAHRNVHDQKDVADSYSESKDTHAAEGGVLFRCENDTNVVSDCVFSDQFCPMHDVRTLGECQEHCRAHLACSALVYNSLRACYLKRDVIPVHRDKERGRTVSCILARVGGRYNRHYHRLPSPILQKNT